MFALDPARAVAEIRRVLRPGGRAAFAVWGPRAANPWLGVVFDAVSAQLGAPVPPPGVPGPFALDDPDRLAGLFADAGRATGQAAGPAARGRQAPLRARLTEATSPYQTPAGLDFPFPGMSLLAAGHRA